MKSSTAQVVTKGEVSLALAGSGTGVNLGVSFGKLHHHEAVEPPGACRPPRHRRDLRAVPGGRAGRRHRPRDRQFTGDGDGAWSARSVRRRSGSARRSPAAQISEHPHIAPWREAYRQFGAKPKEHPSSIENLVRRVLKGWTVPHVNPLVDLYNTISLRHLVPVGGEDLDRVEGDVLLTFATDGRRRSTCSASPRRALPSRAR